MSHLTRAESTTRIPIPRKGTKYLARSRIDLQNSVPVVIAVRDMLKIAKTAKEVKIMIEHKFLKINGKEVKDCRDSIRLFSIFEANKPYILTITPQGRFVFQESKSKDRVCKVINKTLVKQNKIQLNLHDGTNVISSDKIKVLDSVYLDASGKITKHIPFEKGKSCFISSGKYIGQEGKIESVSDSNVIIKLKDKTAELPKKGVIVL